MKNNKNDIDNTKNTDKKINDTIGGVTDVADDVVTDVITNEDLDADTVVETGNTEHTLHVAAEDKNKRLDVYIEEQLTVSSAETLSQDEQAADSAEALPQSRVITRSYIKKLITDGQIEIIGKPLSKVKSGYKLRSNDTIKVTIPADEVLDVIAEDIPLDVIYEDTDILVVNKAAGMVVHPAVGNHTGTLVNAVMHYANNLSDINGVVRPGIVHRLDKDTTGAIIVAKNNAAHLKLSTMFQERNVNKTYLCICKGIFKDKEGRVENSIGRSPKDRKKMAVVQRNGKTAISNYKVLQEVVGFSLVEVKIETGRTHQIRVHMKTLNHPVLGDTVYAKPSKKIDRQLLHAYKLELPHPGNGEPLELIADLPEDFKLIATKLGFNLELI